MALLASSLPQRAGRPTGPEGRQAGGHWAHYSPDIAAPRHWRGLPLCSRKSLLGHLLQTPERAASRDHASPRHPLLLPSAAARPPSRSLLPGPYTGNLRRLCPLSFPAAPGGQSPESVRPNPENLPHSLPLFPAPPTVFAIELDGAWRFRGVSAVWLGDRREGRGSAGPFGPRGLGRKEGERGSGGR